MKFKTFYLTERIPGKSYDFSSTQVDLDPYFQKNIFDWGIVNIPDSILDPEDGRQSEDDIHMTVLYALHSDNPKEVESYVKVFNPFEIELGQVGLFKQDDKDVVKIEVKENFYLQSIHKFLKNNLDNSYKFPEYKPHITVAYVNKNSCDHLVGNKAFDGLKINVTCIVFSSKEGNKFPIYLYGQNKNLNKYGQI